MLDERGARIVADVFAFTNEIRFDAEERWLYVVETSGRRITRLRIGANAEVEEHEVFGPSDTGGFIDGIVLHQVLRPRARHLSAVAAGMTVALAVGFKDATQAVMKWTDEAFASARKLAEVSGSMAYVVANRDIQQMFRDMGRGEATSASVGARSASRPAYMTMMLSAIWYTRDRSWVMMMVLLT